ncbi:LPS assembly protein LptD [Tateyamaria omphalii]|uniref:LPS-assembly protein LptD n=1 Tax=Tateyamaria omphalii TaxID=299262 RepID=UPI001C9916FF|nr:LPS assembly protein LptD [Tateyamaria omphalii]MBY5932758.1 LPS assembly protein LptD [Tateyamaria omphalii]
MRRSFGHVLALVLLMTGWSGPSAAQSQPDAPATEPPPAVLVADDIEVTRDRRLIARGNVEAFQGATRLSAQAIEYNPDTGALTITGPIVVEEGDDVLILASQAELSEDLQNGLLTGARLVLNDQLQLASVQMNRVGGRYTQLYKTAVTSCRICEDDPKPPLWQIRAKRVIHDREARQLYFDGAQLRVLNVPIFYLPRLRLPDPTLERTSGVLFPQIRSNSRLGTGLAVPYFIALGDHRDLTLTPYLSSSTRTLEFRYRQAFRRGNIIVQGAYSNDDVQPDDTRGYLFAAGEFALERGFVLEFDLESISDDAYFNDYGFFGKDRLDSTIQLSRTRRDEFIRLSYVNFKSLRDDEDDDLLPSDVIDALYERRFHPNLIGGEVRLAAEAHAHERPSDVDFDADGDGFADGTDVLRFSFDAEWLRTMQFGGLQTQTTLGLAADVIRVSDDATFDGGDSGLAPKLGVTLRYPLVRRGNNGVRQFFEPIAQFAWVGGDGLHVPNDESTRVEFDEGNLLSLSRFPSEDRRERGWALAYGGTWARLDPDGWSASLTMAQILREEEQVDFNDTSGLSGTTSDFLLAGKLEFDGGLALYGRTLFNESFDVSKAEVRGAWSSNRLRLGGSYIWISEDADIDLDSPIGEVTFDGGFKIDRFWTANASWRYDLEEGRAATAGAEIAYTNECVTVGLSVNRSFADSTTLEPSTSLGLTVSLRGFSVNTGERVETRSCGKQATR